MKGQSRYLRIVQTMTWSRRFIINCQAQQTARISGELTVKEFIDAELVILKLTQGESTKQNESRFNTLDFKDFKI